MVVERGQFLLSRSKTVHNRVIERTRWRRVYLRDGDTSGEKLFTTRMVKWAKFARL